MKKKVQTIPQNPHFGAKFAKFKWFYIFPIFHAHQKKAKPGPRIDMQFYRFVLKINVSLWSTLKHVGFPCVFPQNQSPRSTVFIVFPLGFVVSRKKFPNSASVPKLFIILWREMVPRRWRSPSPVCSTPPKTERPKANRGSRCTVFQFLRLWGHSCAISFAIVNRHIFIFMKFWF